MSNMSTRPTRSRISSPYKGHSKKKTTENINAKQHSTERDQKLLDGWIEPVVPPPRPSYADAGIERHGVVQNMAPLGSRPSLKVLKAAALLESAEGFPRPMSTRKAGTSKPTFTVEPAMTKSSNCLTLESLPSQKASEAQKENSPLLKSIEGTSSLPQSPRKSISSSTTSSQCASKFNSTSQQSPRSLDANVTESAIPRQEFSLSPVVPPATGPDGLPLINLAQTDRVVELAVQDAVDRKRWPTAYALRTLYDDNRGDISFIRLLEAVYYRYATEKDLDEFERLLKPKKHEGRKNRTAEFYFHGDGSDTASRRPIYSAIKALNPPAPAYVTPYTSLTTNKLKSSPTDPPESKGASPSAMNLIKTQPPEPEHVHKKPRKNYNQSNEIIELNNAFSTNVSGAISPPQVDGEEIQQSKSRSNSISSSSSLSSVDVSLIGEVTVLSARPASNHGLARLGLSGSQPVFVSPYASANNFKEAASSANSEARSRVKSISAPPKSGPKIHTFTVAPSTTNPVSSKSQTISTAALDQVPDISTTQLNPIISNQKRSAKFDSSAPPYDSNDERSTKRRKAKELTNNSTISKVSESFERESSQLLMVSQKSEKALEILDINPSNSPIKRPPKIRLNHNISQKLAYGSDRSSPTELGFHPELGLSSLPPHCGTPSKINRSTRIGKIGTGLRTKTSPMKKKSGTSAGIPRGSGDHNSPVGNGASINNDDNDDFCASCGGNGEVVCCDGQTCKRSFHFKCVDPPIMPDALPDTWFCNECQVRRTGHQETNTGPFRLLLLNLEEKNPGAFSLPLEIRSYFESVKTGPDGEYEEITVVKPRSNNRSGWEETPDYFRKRDNKGNPIFCHSCGLQAEAPDRVIIPCSFCNLYWHLDCVNIPLAKEPAPGRSWQCQAHIDDLLRLIPGNLAPAHRFRKIKGAPAIQHEFSRGLKNHGHIEIENDPTDDELDTQPAFYEERSFGRIVKISEKTIKLDFLSRVKREGGGYTRARFGQVDTKKRQSQSQVNSIDQQAALNLIALANSGSTSRAL
ncbi:hypothetical protein K3495_g11004 [Podosphaera aphanis]|nr:hypothetical protein K3495_g11004 [Podosphaera aphanis]